MPKRFAKTCCEYKYLITFDSANVEKRVEKEKDNEFGKSASHNIKDTPVRAGLSFVGQALGLPGTASVSQERQAKGLPYKLQTVSIDLGTVIGQPVIECGSSSMMPSAKLQCCRCQL